MDSLKSFITKHTGLSLFLLAMVIRLLALFFNPACWQESLIKDAFVYHTLAENLISGQGLTFDGNLAQVLPLYPLFLSGVFFLLGTDRLFILLLQGFLGSVLVLYIYLIGSVFFSRRLGIISALVAAVYWPLVTIGLKISTEALFIPLLAASIYYLLQAMVNKRTGCAAAGAVLIGLSGLTRSVIIYFPLILVFLFLINYWRLKDRKILLNAVVYFLFFILTILPWGIRNYNRLGHFIFTTTNTGMVFSTGNMPYKGKFFGFNWRKDWLEPSKRYILDLPEVERDKALKNMAIKHLKENPDQIPKLIFLKISYFISPFDWEVLGHEEGIFNPWFFWAFLFAAIGFSRIKWKPEYLVPSGLLLYFLLISLPAYASPRLRLPMEPFLILFTCLGWVEVEKKLESRKKIIILLILILSSSVVGLAYSGFIKEACRSVFSAAGLW